MSGAIGRVNLGSATKSARYRNATTKGSTQSINVRAVLVPYISVALPDMLFDLASVSNPLSTNSAILDNLCTNLSRYHVAIKLLIREVLQ